MTHYRLYALDKDTGKIRSGTDIVAESDAEAIQAGHRAHPDTPFEIWCQSRRVFTTHDQGSGQAA